MEIEIVNELRKKLICGEAIQIAKEAKVSTATVYYWLRGRAYPRQEARIIEAAKNIISRRNKQLEQNKEDLKELLTQL